MGILRKNGDQDIGRKVSSNTCPWNASMDPNKHSWSTPSHVTPMNMLGRHDARDLNWGKSQFSAYSPPHTNTPKVNEIVSKRKMSRLLSVDTYCHPIALIQEINMLTSWFCFNFNHNRWPFHIWRIERVVACKTGMSQCWFWSTDRGTKIEWRKTKISFVWTEGTMARLLCSTFTFIIRIFCNKLFQNRL